MSDPCGHIDEIVRAFREYPAGDVSTRMAVRKALKAEHERGWQAGYSAGLDDQYRGEEAERRLAKRASAPVEYAWTGTSPRGEDISGKWFMSPLVLAAVVRDRYDLGWHALKVTCQGTEVAGIGPDPAKPGELTWWAPPAGESR